MASNVTSFIPIQDFVYAHNAATKYCLQLFFFALTSQHNLKSEVMNSGLQSPLLSSIRKPRTDCIFVVSANKNSYNF